MSYLTAEQMNEQISQMMASALPIAVLEQEAAVEALIQPDENGEFSSPLNGSLWMANLGIRQIPLRPKTKIAFLPNWQDSATTDSAQIKKWAAENVNCNFGSVAKEGEYFVFEADSKEVRERFSMFGGKFSAKLIIQSSTPEKGHRWYRWTEGVEGVSQAAVKFNDFSLRVDNAYCVSPGSIHPTTLRQYRVAVNGIPDVPTQDEIDFWKSERTVDKVDASPNGPPIPHGAHDGTLFKIACKMRGIGMEEDAIATALVEICEKRCENYGRSDYVEMCKAKARQACKYAPNVDGVVTMGGKPVGTNSQTNAVEQTLALQADDEPEEAFDDKKQETFPECPIFTGALTDLAKALCPSLPLEFKQMALITRWGLLRSGLDTLKTEKHLQPRFYTVLVCYPNRGKTAANNESRKAIEFIFEMAKAEVGKKNNSAPSVRTFGDFEERESVDSGPALCGLLYETVEDAKKNVQMTLTTDSAGKLMLDPDELSAMFEKSRSSNARVSTMFHEMLKLHSGNKTGNTTKATGDKPVDNAHISILGGCTVGVYKEQLWTGTGAGKDGLMSRFLAITTNAPPIPPVPLPTDGEAASKAYQHLARLLQLPGQEIAISDDAAKMLSDWWGSFDNGKASASRIMETVKQLLIVLAVANAPEDHQGTTLTVGTDLMRQAIAFGEYEIAVREQLNPDDSWSVTQNLENIITRWMQKNSSKKDPKTRNECRRGIHPHRIPGGLGVFLIAWNNVVNAHVLKFREKSQRGGRYSL